MDQKEVDVILCRASTVLIYQATGWNHDAPSPNLAKDLRKASETVFPGPKGGLSLVVTKKYSLGFPDVLIAAPRVSSF